MLAEFQEWLTETVTVEKASGSHDRYGRRTSSTSDTVDCRVERSPRLVRNAEGHEVLAGLTLFCDSDDITAADRLTLDGETLDIIAIDTITLEDGVVHHQEVSCR